jgi:hypothetical protein
MQKLRTVLFLLSLFSFPAFSQVTLGNSIACGLLPNDSDHITTPVTYIDTTGEFLLSGFAAGTLVPDFTLYNVSGNPTTLSTTLNQGKPVLLVSVALSCPSSRHSIPYVLDSITAVYGNQLNILLIYIVEPHPIYPDVSPYTEFVWEIPSNVDDSACVHQETTYLARKQECTILMNRFNITVPVLVDGTSNEYWSTFGPAPNKAYLLTPAGIVYQQYGWFDRSDSALMMDIPAVLAMTGVNATGDNSGAQIFPNPSNGNSSLTITNESSYGFRIVDIAGRVVADEESVSANVSDLGDYQLSAGVYSVIVETQSGRSFSLRYIVQ